MFLHPLVVAVSVASLVRADCAQLELLGNGLQGEVAKIPLAVRGIARGALGGLEKVEPIDFHVNLIQLPPLTLLSMFSLHSWHTLWPFGQRMILSLITEVQMGHSRSAVNILWAQLREGARLFRGRIFFFFVASASATSPPSVESKD